MGVTGLWTVVAPTARPTKLETLNRKRLAVDASIWIYQFLKAVRDKEGNALRNSHVVGFFRRICKLLYFGIKPVFVFDGGAPSLKRETVRTRARRREGRREDAVRTAGKLLAVQVARAAEEEDNKRRKQRERTPLEEELPPDQELVYVDELGMNAKERQAGRTFKRKDQYHLPDLDVSIESLGAPNDPRIMSQAELEEYAKQFHSGEDINLYDFSKIDFESPFFLSLPPGDRYNILNAARLRSRLRMGLSKDQLDGMFPDRLAFSKFQIERVKERNELTQRLMHINGMAEDSWDQGGRIVGEKGKEYILVKNEGVEGGWALGVVSNKSGTKREDAIDLDDEGDSVGIKSESEEEDFEDVAIEGLNRLPKSMQRNRRDLREVDYDISYEEAAARIARKRQAVYAARKKAAEAKEPETKAVQSVAPVKQTGPPQQDQDESLFVPDDKASDAEDDLFEDVDISAPYDNDDDDEEKELQRAIALSLDQPEAEESGGFFVEEDTIANEDDGVDLAAALAESRKTKYQSKTHVRKTSPTVSSQPQFSGPLPFESLNLGQSLLGKKKAKKVEEDLSGGFDKDVQSKKKAQPIPTWFETVPTNDDSKKWDDVQRNETQEGKTSVQDNAPKIQQKRQKQVIDLEAEDVDEQILQATSNYPSEAKVEQLYAPEQDEVDEPTETNGNGGGDGAPENEANDVDADMETEKEKAAKEREERYRIAREIAAENESQEITMDNLADMTRAKPPSPTNIPTSIPNEPSGIAEIATEKDSAGSDVVDWSESDDEPQTTNGDVQMTGSSIVGDRQDPVQQPDAESEEDEIFEDVDVEPPSILDQQILRDEVVVDATDPSNEQYLMEDANEPANPDVEDYLSDSDEELMRQLAIEAEEHARFATELNANKSQAEARRDYENELKQLRSQQKRDRRDADEVTQVMIQECQALLRLFGLPYLTAPMEAEAQCAELVHLGLVDGIVTDDSDIFLFGGTRIYKNMFNAAKFVECYLSSDLEKEYALDREKLIRFAHLLGSDYTDGIPGIGPVTALEIISDFQDLEEFKQWCSAVQLGRPQDLENQLTTPFRRKFKRTVQKKLFLPTAFPDLRVDQAYLKPDVDSDPEEFQWGLPDLDKLRGFLMATIGWSQDRTDEILVPVIRDINRREQEGTQANITRFFGGAVGVGANEGTAPRNRTGKESGRMKNAYTRLRGEAQKRRLNLEDADIQGSADDEGGDDDDEEDIDNVDLKTNELDDEHATTADDEADVSKKNKSKRSRKTKVTKKRKLDI